MHVFHSFGHVLGGTLLIAGTTIGVGMLALPVATGPAGFFPSVLIYLLCWCFMLCTGLLLLEVCSWMPKDANLITMASRLLGPVGKNVCWVLYLFLFVTVMIAHVAGTGSIVAEITNGAIPPWLAMILYVLLLSPVVYLGAKSVDRLNLFLMVGVLITYIVFITVSYDHVDYKLLNFANWSKSWIALPVLFTSFTYQLIIPTLMTYMDRNVKKVRLAIVLGTSIPLIVYLIWEFLILGIVPVENLVQAGLAGDNAVMPLKQLVGSSLLFEVGKYFAFFTLTTSYIGLALAFLDFLADGLKIKKVGIKKVGLCMLMFVPPTVISLIYPDIFIKALGYAGGISCAILFGFFPPAMVWVGRYVKRYSLEDQQLRGGKPVLIVLSLFVIFELGIQVADTFF